uniref:Uncharacterized protein n=1 Tax=Steinernema glaseri TaxID=37863 RepID=A0A1I7XXA0_9BILA
MSCRLVVNRPTAADDHGRRQAPESLDDFLTIHKSLKPLDSLDFHWTIYCVDRNCALLVELPQKTTYYEAKRFPFCYIPFFEE